MPCWRGPALYDDASSKAAITKWVRFYKTHRDILSSDIIHLRRADHQGIDAILHVNPALPTKGLAMIFNPMPEAASGSFSIDLYYTGLNSTARVTEQEEGAPILMPLARDYTVTISYAIAARNVTWFTFE